MSKLIPDKIFNEDVNFHKATKAIVLPPPHTSASEKLYLTERDKFINRIQLGMWVTFWSNKAHKYLKGKVLTIAKVQYGKDFEIISDGIMYLAGDHCIQKILDYQ